jgi:hypothetical protein
MERIMKAAFKLYRRKKIYYCEHIESGQQESLHTRDKDEATRQLHAKNEAAQMGASNLQIARVYMGAADPHMPLRTWQEVIQTVIDSKKGPNQTRWKNAEKDKALTSLWKLRVVETRAHQLLRMLQNGTVSTNVFLRRLHNFAQDMTWLPWPILPKRLWPKVVYQEKRAITNPEHLQGRRI